ncbi:transposase family protein [Actinopolymorpha pittospori]|uniref:transposase family protein n=1 Tax=Actinopolymorpha pittospori TaxID=648752 RepID=UPI001789B622
MAAAACAVLAGAKSLTAIAEWAAAASGRPLSCCGAALHDPDQPHRAPSEATMRRVLQPIDGYRGAPVSEGARRTGCDHRRLAHRSCQRPVRRRARHTVAIPVPPASAETGGRGERETPAGRLT